MDRASTKEPFLDLLNSLHRWCNSDDALPEMPTDWFAVSGLEPPGDPDGWFCLGRTPVGEWELPTLPPGWEPAWWILSRHEHTLTVEALDYLEEHVPGAIAAALPEPSGASLLGLDSAIIPDRHEDWSLDDIISCIERELKRREQLFPEAVKDSHMTFDDAAQELSQMRAILHNLITQRPNSSSTQPETKTHGAIDELPRQEPLL